jgi:FkbM family methyltransferase
MFSRLSGKASRGIRRAASFPVELLELHSRASAVERLSERMLISIPTGAGRIQFFCPSPLLTNRAETLLSKEPDTIEWIDRFEGPAVFWDVGANVGVFSLYAAMKSDISVLSFEPLAANFHVLSRNIQINDFGNRITSYCVALSGTTELGLLNIQSPAMGSALTQFGRLGDMSPYCVPGTHGVTQGMIGFTIDDFIHQFQLGFPNYIKVDVDGLEWSILQGARKTLENSSLRSLMVELSVSNKPETEQARCFLEGYGFQLAGIGAPQVTEAGAGANHLFVRH